MSLTSDGCALMEFKNGLTRRSLFKNWRTPDTSPCAWGGIDCTETGPVRRITLSAQAPMLESGISASLGKLKSLEELWLDKNSLSESIPLELGNLNSVKILSLSMNLLTGEIPSQLGNCSRLLELGHFRRTSLNPSAANSRSMNVQDLENINDFALELNS